MQLRLVVGSGRVARKRELGRSPETDEVAVGGAGGRPDELDEGEKDDEDRHRRPDAPEAIEGTRVCVCRTN